MHYKGIYSVVAYIETEGLEWEQELIESMAVCRTCTKAYLHAKRLAKISNPDKGYRRVLETLKRKGAVEIRQRGGGEEKAIIVFTRIF